MHIKKIFYSVVNCIVSILLFSSLVFLLFSLSALLFGKTFSDNSILFVFFIVLIISFLITNWISNFLRKKYSKTTITIPAEYFYRYRASSTTQNALSGIDCMDGHDFEHWCASVLRNNGFINVEVTPPSGDHGVDVLAQKDGIKYAIQCKRYTHDLDNTPVQEVHAGKAMYNCHVGAVITNRYFTEGAKRLAEVNGVLLWDRDWIMKHTGYQVLTGYPQNAFSFSEYNDELFPDAVEVVLDAGYANPELIRDRLSIGYARAARIIDELEAKGVIGPFCGATPRSVLITRDVWESNK